MKAVAGIVGGFILAFLAMTLASITLGAGMLDPRVAYLGVSVGVITWALGLFIAFRAPSAAKAWRRLLLSSAVLSFLLPVSGLIFTGSMLSTSTSGSGAGAVSTVISGGLLLGALGFMGFFLGIAFLVVGLLVGRDSKLVYVQVSEGVPPAQASAERSSESRPMMPAKRVAPVETSRRMPPPLSEAPEAPDPEMEEALRSLRRPRTPV